MTDEKKESKKERVRLEYSDEHGLTVHVTNDGLSSLVDELGAVVNQVMKDSPIAKGIRESLAGGQPERPEMPPTRVPKMPPVKLTTTTENPELQITYPSEVTSKVESMGAMEPQTDEPWQEANAPLPHLIRFDQCPHKSLFIAADAEALLTMILRLGYKKTHAGKFMGAGIYCADCLHKVE